MAVQEGPQTLRGGEKSGGVVGSGKALLGVGTVSYGRGDLARSKAPGDSGAWDEKTHGAKIQTLASPPL